MADLVSYGNPERDIEQALITLKKGTQLVKYSRKGKPKFCPFRISTDETTLIWYSHGKERNLKLSTISRIIPGQRTAVFRRFLRPEKDYLSFSLLYNNGERSLDLICKDKVEVEVWLSGLKTLISPAQRSRRSKSDISDITDVCEFQTYRPFGASLEATSSLPRESISNFRSSDVGSSDRGNMQPRSSSADGFRISVSSAPSSSSQGSGPDDIESLGDVYIWGEVWSDSNLVEGSVNSLPSKIDVLIPKPLESNVVLDVQQIACGFRHVALLTRQGEVFTWGEESGGRLGHGIGTDLSHPQLVDYLALNNADYVACGEYHTCAVTTSGDVFTWGDGTQNTGLLGHGSDISHWTPKRVSGPLEGIQILSVSCGTWHTALVTSTGKLFTYGDGAFGVLGHGDRETVAYPREVESLSGLKTVKVACAPWHTAAIVEVMSQSGSNISSRKLFTWGDGDKYRLGHGDKEPKLVPTCVPSLIDYNFYNLACGNSITVALTTSGHVFTMGNSEYGQLGNPLSDGKTPRLVQDKLVGEFIEEISCGEAHVAVLTSRNEVLTWGRGANGRLGHGDHEDRKSPTLVEALKDRHVKSISCGSNFTACICIHKWVSGADQSLCSGCRQAFGFTRKRHNCYNCGLVHCHTCSSKKALKAALAPTPGKPHRVCDSCYAKLKGAESGIPTTPVTKKPVTPRKSSTDNRIDRGEVKSSRTLLSPSPDLVKFVDVKMVKPAIKPEPVPVTQGNQVQSVFQLKDMGFQSPFSALQFGLKPVNTSTPQPTPQPQAQTPSQPPMPSRPASPYRKPSPPRAATPLFSKSLIDSLKKTNELLNQEVLKLQTQVKNLKEKCQNQDVEMQKSQKEAQEAAAMAAMVTEEASSGRVAKEFIKTIAAQFKEMKETLPAEVCEIESFKSIQSQLECMVKTKESQSSEFYSSLPADCLEPDQQNDTTISDSSQRGEGSKQYENKESDSNERNENGSKTPIYTEVTEQFEPGVYITLSIRNGTRIFKRVRFSKKRFVNQQAEEWWKENKDRVLKRYNYPVGNDSAQTASSSNSAPNEDEEAAPPS